MSPLLLTLWIACQAFDGATTVAVLKGGGYEANPVMAGSPARMTAIKVSVNIGGFIWGRKLVKDYPKHGITHVVPVIGAVTGCAAATHNVGSLKSR
jgi:hypothetical protein